MLERVFRTEDVHAADRLESWQQYLSRTNRLAGVDSAAADFRVFERHLDLGSAVVWRQVYPEMTVRRTPSMIRRSDPEAYQIAFLLKGTATIAREGHTVTCEPYRLLLSDSSQPSEVQARGNQGLAASVGIAMPKTLLPPLKQAHQVAEPLTTARHGIGALLAGFLTELTMGTTTYGPSDGPRLGLVAVDLARALFSHLLEAEHILPTETRRRTLNLRIQSFIRQHLHDPGLTPDTIAAAHHISTSYLHRLYETEAFTVAAWIRTQRLEHARRDLADPAQCSVPIHRIATRWGFTHHAVFSRAFRTAFGTTPLEYRHHATADTQETRNRQC